MHPVPRIRRAARNALLLEIDGLGAMTLAVAVGKLQTIPGVIAAIPGDASILLLLDDGLAGGHPSIDVERDLADAFEAAETATPRLHRIPVRFAEEDGPDLPQLLRHCGMDRSAWIEALSRLRLTARFLGFRAAFAYLEGLPRTWALPRRAAPRAHVPAGSFAIAGERAGFYPVDSPGGWNLLGRTDVLLWDPWRDPPGLIAPGDDVELVPVDVIRPLPPATRATAGGTVIAEVLAPGQQTTVVSAADYSRLRRGLAAGGPFDGAAAGAANAAVGNPPGAAVLECYRIGPQLLAHCDLLVSWCGADASLDVGSSRIVAAQQFAVPAGEILKVGRIERGARGWLAIRGGVAAEGPPFDVAPWKIGRGDLLRSAGLLSAAPRFSGAARRRRPEVLTARRGPHAMLPPTEAWIAQSLWRVEEASDRIGVRLRAGRPPAEAPASTPSAGLLPGALQWTPGGGLVVMGPDHPVTGGYLHIATVEDLSALAQLSPGDEVRMVLG